MNCKPGDLAVVITVRGYPHLDRWLGAVVTVVHAGPIRHPFGLMWEVEHRHIQRVADTCLRPILNPGDDATDETLVFAGKPKSDAAPMVTKEAA